jgi:hypothetical protein
VLWCVTAHDAYVVDAGRSDELFSVGAVGRTWNWSDIQDFGLSSFTRIYDNDVIQVFLPCSNDTCSKKNLHYYFILILLYTSRYQLMASGQNPTHWPGIFAYALSLSCPAP